MNAEFRRTRPPRIFAALLLLMAAAFLYGGVQLLIVGGSAYYLLAGMATAASALFLFRGDKFGSRLYGWFLAATLVWSLVEAGADLWALAPRLFMLSVIGLWFLTPFVRRGLYSPASPPALLSSPLSKATTTVAALIVAVVIFFGVRNPVDELPQRIAGSTSTATSTEWQHYGNTTHGTRFARLEQITSQNVGKLKEVWHYRTGRSGQFKATPLQVGDSLYMCAAMNVVIALDAETGEKRWEYDPKMKVAPVGFNTTCRGVGYYHADAKYNGEYQGDCPDRIITATTDARLIALNAKTGERCRDFGNGGEVSLLPGIGEVKPNYYLVTSPPLLARNRIVVGARVVDNFEVQEPSGVLRAYDAVTGKFVWAWDMGRPGVNTEPKDGEVYTRGTPNMWSMMSFDDQLGLVYAPLGNATPDFFGAHRIEASEKYASSVVALDINDGSLRWSYQTVHHDIWDYDVPSQPALIDIPQADGSVTPALVQATKRSELFLLDRRNGKPIAEVVEKPVPQNPVAGEWLSKTQPFSVGMPDYAPDLTEADMWGLTPFDQLWCRIEFKSMRYEGQFTPPTEQGSLQFPGNAGGFNWGSVAIDEDQKLLVVQPMNMSSRVQLYPRDQIPKGTRYQQKGTPYGASVRMFMSPLSVPCQKPPFGRMSVIDLQTNKVLWTRRLGTTNEMGPLGIRVRAALPMGVPISAGSFVTKGGLIFYGGAMDRYFRAFDLKTGKILWSDYLPGAGQATPMSYMSPKSQRQIVLITVPNAQRRMGIPQGDEKEDVEPEGGHVIAYALPE